MDYFKIFSDSIKLWWKNKFLWILGIIAVIFGGGGSGGFANFPSLGNISDKDLKYLDTQQISSFILSPLFLIVILVALIVVLFFFALGIFLKSRADASIISSTEKLRKNNSLSFGEMWTLSKTKWLKLFWLNALVDLPILVIVLFMIIGVVILVFSLINGGSPLIWIALFFFVISMLCLMTIYGVIARVVYTFAARISVLQNKGVMECIKEGWKFTLKNISHLIVFWVLFLLVSFVTGLIIFILTIFILPIIFVIGIPLLLINVILGILVFIVLFCLFGIIMILISGPIYSFTEAYWTIVYLELTK